MGRHLDFVHMAGAPETANCPRCGAEHGLSFDDLDSDVADDESGCPDYDNAAQCECGCEFEVKLRLHSTVTVNETHGRFA
jgi:hypothetical protein